MEEQPPASASAAEHPHYLFAPPHEVPPYFLQNPFQEMEMGWCSKIMEEDDEKSRNKRGRIKKSSLPQRFAFQTRSEEDVLDDGYRWRKYGQKSLKNTRFPRSYYRCTHHTCNVKKQVERLSKDSSIVMTTYDGSHDHPSENLMQSLTPLLNQIHFLTSPTSNNSSLL